MNGQKKCIDYDWENNFNLKISDDISFERNKTEIIIVLAVYMIDTYLHTFIVTLSEMIPFNWSLNI